MKKLLAKLFVKDPKVEILEFTKIIREGSDIAICFTDSCRINYKLIQQLASWKKQYEQISFYLPQKQVSLSQNVALISNYRSNSIEDIGSINSEFIINFSDDKKVLEILKTKVNSVIADIDNRFNLLFEPLFENEVELLLQLEDFFEEKLDKVNLELSFKQENRIDSFILDIGNEISGRKCLTLIDNLKKDYSYEISLIGPEINTAEFVSLQKYPTQNIFEKYKMAVSGKVFFTDDEDVAMLFSYFGLDLIYIGKQKLDGIMQIDVMNNFEMKNAIPEILNRG